MASKQRQVRSAPPPNAVQKLTSESAFTTRTLWLAGLGAVSLTGRKGEKLVAGLVDEGCMLGARARLLIAEIGADAQTQLLGWLAPVGERVQAEYTKAVSFAQHSIDRVLGQLGVPLKADIEELACRVVALSQQLRTMK